MMVILGSPVATDRENLSRSLLNSDDVRQRYARLFTVLICMLVALEVEVNLHLQELEPIVLGSAEP